MYPAEITEIRDYCFVLDLWGHEDDSMVRSVGDRLSTIADMKALQIQKYQIGIWTINSVFDYSDLALFRA
ncbi:MAG: hypothetical protein CMM12_00020 [Rhodospirillaceae bacterium]|nr:hypothetical protein [Rhodospirillaceae bacterium]